MHMHLTPPVNGESMQIGGWLAPSSGEHAAPALGLGDAADAAHQRRGAQVHAALLGDAEHLAEGALHELDQPLFTSSSVQKKCCEPCTHSK